MQPHITRKRTLTKPIEIRTYHSASCNFHETTLRLTSQFISTPSSGFQMYPIAGLSTTNNCWEIVTVDFPFRPNNVVKSSFSRVSQTRAFMFNFTYTLGLPSGFLSVDRRWESSSKHEKPQTRPRVLRAILKSLLSWTVEQIDAILLFHAVTLLFLELAWFSAPITASSLRGNPTRTCARSIHAGYSIRRSRSRRSTYRSPSAYLSPRAASSALREVR